ncbi:MAG TPA: SIS domain-containing protein [Micropepsaceae bacterium]|jgi:glucosamine--fructose-6-phosphate aminotransferase (isomerizing)|nr:SIS domain-containing protein [Micropepsaceae bacterium]
MASPQPSGTISQIAAEIQEAPEAVRRQERELAGPIEELVRRLKARPPRLVVTAARGSSAHAATFAKHAIERHAGIPVASAAPSIVTVYRRDLKLEGQLLLAISQSGESDDLIEQTLSAKRSGALTVALVNATASPLARASDIVLPICAGPEHSVAATKSFVASLAALLRLTAAWAADETLSRSVARLPERLDLAAGLDWSDWSETLSAASNLIVLGRGPTLGIAREAALKLKETCNLHAEAFSGAEFLHGPISLVTREFPILIFMPADAAAGALIALAGDLRRKRATVFTVGAQEGEGRLPVVAAEQPEADAICAIQSFYAALPHLAKLRGLDADRPRHLQKVTRTR